MLAGSGEPFREVRKLIRDLTGGNSLAHRSRELGLRDQQLDLDRKQFELDRDRAEAQLALNRQTAEALSESGLLDVPEVRAEVIRRFLNGTADGVGGQQPWLPSGDVNDG